MECHVRDQEVSVIVDRPDDPTEEESHVEKEETHSKLSYLGSSSSVVNVRQYSLKRRLKSYVDMTVKTSYFRFSSLATGKFGMF